MSHANDEELKMKTTTYTGFGVQGQTVRKELAAKGEIVVVTTGSQRFRNLREVTGQVTGHKARRISGTSFFVWETVVLAADGETFTERRVRPATDTEAAEFATATAPAPAATVTKIVSPEEAVYMAHTSCVRCFGGRTCEEGMRLWEAWHAVQHWTKAPIVATDRWGHRRGFWDMESALAHIGFNGGSITKAPAGMVEAVALKREADDKAREERRAERLAAGITLRPRRRR